MKVYVVTSEFDVEDDGDRNHSLVAVFSTLEAAEAWKAADPGIEWCHYDIQGLEVDAPDQAWELHDDPRCGIG